MSAHLKIVSVDYASHGITFNVESIMNCFDSKFKV